MPTNRRLNNIARDLEKLPCELHEPVLVDLEFQQLIRLSSLAGPRLKWSLENSLLSWNIFFRNGFPEVFQNLLMLTDRLKWLCFALPGKKGEEPSEFETGRFCFLHYRSPDWTSWMAWKPRNKKLDCDTLDYHWRWALRYHLVRQLRFTYHQDYWRMVQPWEELLEHSPNLPSVPSPKAVLAEVGVLQHFDPWINENPLLSVEQLTNIMDVDHELRRVKARVLSGELRQFALLYDKHPTRLKQPFAPQTQRRNKKHVPWNLRCVSRRMINTADHHRYKYPRTYASYFRFEFPTLVPYDWCMQLFPKVLESKKLFESDASKDMLEKCRMVLEKAPRWAVAVPEITSAQPEDHPTEEVLGELGQLALHSQYPLRTHLLLENTRSTGVIHLENDMQWLETFLDIIAWMEETYPDVVLEVTGGAQEELLKQEEPRV